MNAEKTRWVSDDVGVEKMQIWKKRCIKKIVVKKHVGS